MSGSIREGGFKCLTPDMSLAHARVSLTSSATRLVGDGFGASAVPFFPVGGLALDTARQAARGSSIRRVAVPQPRPSDSFVQRFTLLTRQSPKRFVDIELRALDLLFAGAFLLVSLPLTLTIAAAIVLTSSPPLFYRGERVGRGGRIFHMLKFRTLRRGAEERLGPYLGVELIERTKAETTVVGRWLRATQLDEIPQLWNVLRGDMSLVGPRPIRPRFFEELASELPGYWQRLVVRPGLTGVAQVRKRYETSMAEKLAHDLEYIADRSVWIYLRTLLATAWRVLGQSLRGLFRPRH